MSVTTSETESTTALPETWSGEMKALLVLGLPMAAAQLVQFSIYFFDTIMIGRLSAEDLAAAAQGSVLYFLFWMLASGPVATVTPLVSQVLGADNNETKDCRRTVRMSLWFSAAIFPIVLFISFFAETILVALGQNSDVSARAQLYIYALAPGLPFAIATMALRNFLATLGKTLIPFVLVVAGTLINIGLNWVFIFGNLGAPGLGLIGAGIASSIACLICFLFFVIYIKIDAKASRFDVFTRLHVPDWERFKEMLQLGWPISITISFEGMLFNAVVIIVGVIGVAQQAAYQVALNVASCAFMMPFGMAMAGSVRIGLARGANNKAAERRASTTTIIACILAIGIAAVPIGLNPDFFASLYLSVESADKKQVYALVVSFLPIAVGFMFFDSVQVACNQLLRGLKDVKWPMVLTGVSYWLIGFPVAYYLALHTSLGAKGAWYGLMAGLIAAFILLGIRLAQQVVPGRVAAPHQ